MMKEIFVTGIFLGASINVILVLIAMIRTRKEKVDYTKTYYPIGYKSYKSFFLSWAIFIIFLVMSIRNAYSEDDYATKVMLGIALYIWFIAFVLLKNKYYDNKAYVSFRKNLDIARYEKEMMAVFANEKIHPETKNFYRMQYAQAIMLFSKEKYLKISEQIFEPKEKRYKKAYQMYSLNFLLPYQEFKRQSNAVLSSKYIHKKKILEYVWAWELYYTGKTFLSKEKLLRRYPKNLEEDSLALFLSILYYSYASNMKEANRLKDEFMEKYSSLSTLVELLDEHFAKKEEEISKEQ